MTVPPMPTAPLDPLATDADTAQRHAGPCHLCGRAIKPGQRYALLPGLLPAHLVCIAGQPGTAA